MKSNQKCSKGNIKKNSNEVTNTHEARKLAFLGTWLRMETTRAHTETLEVTVGSVHS